MDAPGHYPAHCISLNTEKFSILMSGTWRLMPHRDRPGQPRARAEQCSSSAAPRALGRAQFQSRPPAPAAVRAILACWADGGSPFVPATVMTEGAEYWSDVTGHQRPAAADPSPAPPPPPPLTAPARGPVQEGAFGG